MSLWHCSASSLTGFFGDYIHARNRSEARLKFWRKHGVTPFRVYMERRRA